VMKELEVFLRMWSESSFIECADRLSDCEGRKCVRGSGIWSGAQDWLLSDGCNGTRRCWGKRMDEKRVFVR
jgi:hypothetical protein